MPFQFPKKRDLNSKRPYSVHVKLSELKIISEIEGFKCIYSLDARERKTSFFMGFQAQYECKQHHLLKENRNSPAVTLKIWQCCFGWILYSLKLSKYHSGYTQANYLHWKANLSISPNLYWRVLASAFPDTSKIMQWSRVLGLVRP